MNKYNIVAIGLHWIIGLAFILMLASGFAMMNLDIPQSLKFNMFQWHKSLGVILLWAVGFRVIWRLFHKPPALPDVFSSLDKIAAKLGHLGLYALMIAMPISGWVMVSSSPIGLPTYIFNLFEWPHVPGLEGNKMVSNSSKLAHEIMAWVILVFVILHIAAVIKHKVKDKVNLLPRILPSILFLVALVMVVSPAQAKRYDVVKGQSTIEFFGTHAGNKFEGMFREWDADITFDFDLLTASAVSVTFDMKHAQTGNNMYDNTLEKTDWFNVLKFPTATFSSTSFKKTDIGHQVTGNLTIKDITNPVTFDFALQGDDKDVLTATAKFPINRLDFDIGTESDPESEWVSNEIIIKIHLVVKPTVE